MKSKITLLILLLSLIGYSQNGINYKAVIKDDLGNVVANSDDIVMQFDIIQGVGTVYSETHTPMSDGNGIIIVNIGEGTAISGNFSTINWVNGNQSLNVQVDIGSGFEDMGTTEFKVVPYALTSGDKAWEKTGNNIYKNFGNVGIGTNSPTELLHIYDASKAAINLVVPSYSNQSQIEFKNGSEIGAHSFFKLSNELDIFKISLDSDIGSATGYEDKLSINNGGLALENGNRINEFSTDVTLGGNSNNAVPTEGAVKSYVDNHSQSNYWRRTSLSSNSITATSTFQPIGPSFVINKEFADSNIEVTLNSRISGGTFSSSSVNGVGFEIRIDGASTINHNRGAINTTNTLDFVSMFAVFQGLSVGSHTIQIYAYTSSFGDAGTSSNVIIDPGNWQGAIIAKETF